MATVTKDCPELGAMGVERGDTFIVLNPYSETATYANVLANHYGSLRARINPDSPSEADPSLCGTFPEAWCRQRREIWRIGKLDGILYLLDVGSKTTSFSSAFAGIFASN